jgi:hypothetical protein
VNIQSDSPSNCVAIATLVHRHCRVLRFVVCCGVLYCGMYVRDGKYLFHSQSWAGLAYSREEWVPLPLRIYVETYHTYSITELSLSDFYAVMNGSLNSLVSFLCYPVWKCCLVMNRAFAYSCLGCFSQYRWLCTGHVRDSPLPSGIRMLNMPQSDRYFSW